MAFSTNEAMLMLADNRFLPVVSLAWVPVRCRGWFQAKTKLFQTIVLLHIKGMKLEQNTRKNFDLSHTPDLCG